MKKRMFTVVFSLLVLFGLVFGWKAFVSYKTRAFMASRGIPVITVSTAQVEPAHWHRQIHSVATLLATQGVTLAAQLPGAVTAIDFHSGEAVRAGSPLVQVDDRPQLAQLAYDIAQMRLAWSNLRRTRILYKGRAASRAQLDTVAATYDSAKARVAGDRATINQLALRAPFTGVLGIRQVNLGQYLAPGTPIVDLQSYENLYANFDVPQQDLAHIHLHERVELTVDSYPNRVFSGQIHAVDATVNPQTRNLLVQAEIPNQDGALRPGMFGDARVISKTTTTVLTVPAVALTYNTYGDTVYVVRHVTKNGKSLLVAKQVLVRTGEQRGSRIAIRSGLKAGWTVVTAGQVKLHNGMPVAVNDSVQP
ncbi:MAG: efflux RND transporter periplasmic adaptor subunit [Gammaproteobacteria bacterium]|nr:efflux RND transporter periplasmic adaptor subunit [Gammaproteobacteria bacterium]